MENNRFSILSDYENVDWVKVIPILIAFAHKLLSFQNLRIKDIGQLASDFASEAIVDYLENKNKFDPTRNPDLIYYLKFNLLQRIISNYVKSADNKKILAQQVNDNSMIESLIEHIPIDESIDVNSIVLKIQTEIKNDELINIIFDAKYEENMKRSETCKVF